MGLTAASGLSTSTEGIYRMAKIVAPTAKDHPLNQLGANGKAPTPPMPAEAKTKARVKSKIKAKLKSRKRPTRKVSNGNATK
jgi:hypothetical protein